LRQSFFTRLKSTRPSAIIIVFLNIFAEGCLPPRVDEDYCPAVVFFLAGLPMIAFFLDRLPVASKARSPFWFLFHGCFSLPVSPQYSIPNAAPTHHHTVQLLPKLLPPEAIFSPSFCFFCCDARPALHVRGPFFSYVFTLHHLVRWSAVVSIEVWRRPLFPPPPPPRSSFCCAAPAVYQSEDSNHFFYS